MKATSKTEGAKKCLTEILRDIAFWFAVALGVICLSALYEWLDSMLT